jgi:hypothetical protein
MARTRRGARGAVALAVVALAAMLGGCELAALIGGEGQQDALHKFDKGTKVLVLVDVRDGVGVPPAYTTGLGDEIGVHLWKNEAVDVPVVPQGALIALQQANPDEYKKLGIADIAQATGADEVLEVYITQLSTPATSDSLVTTGYAEAYVKIIDKKGQRIWPGDATGMRVEARVDPSLLTDKTVAQVQKELAAKLATRTGRMFHTSEIEGHRMER